jgi:hypothetical protein
MAFKPVPQNNPAGASLDGPDMAALVAFDSFIESLVREDDEDARQARMMAAVLSATTAEEVLEAGGVVKAEKVLDHRLCITDVWARPSDYTQGPRHFLMFDCLDETSGKAITVECGAADIVIKVGRMVQLGLLPITLKIHRKDKATKAGYFPLFAEFAPPAFD